MHVWLLLISFIAISTTARAHEPEKPCNSVVQLPSNHGVSRHCQLLKPRRIVIVTTDNRHDRLKEQDLFARSLATHLGKSPGLDVAVATEKICRDHLPMRSGTFDELELLALSKKYRADCVLYCDIGQLVAYEPMLAETSMLLVHVSEAVALVSANETYDMRDIATRDAYLEKVDQGDSRSALNVAVHTPSSFIDFASSKFALGILSVW